MQIGYCPSILHCVGEYESALDMHIYCQNIHLNNMVPPLDCHKVSSAAPLPSGTQYLLLWWVTSSMLEVVHMC